MIDHYNAFISYRHAPEDIKVAEAVQRGLERFHIPHKIRKQTGMKRIQQIFRDKDELPITSNLTDTISNALYNSDYLIVICSTNTKDSIWVQREIEFFLRNHSKNQILTVLVNGEPQEVIPEVLTYEEKTIIDYQGMYQTVRTPIEPLSCDYRMPFKKAKKIELPRLASALIGCSYDELMNRRRQYMMHRMGLIFGALTIAAASFSTYLYISLKEIKKNYLNSLRNQSRFLANESTHLLEDEQRITALELAIEALPKDEDDVRPVTPEAIRAITDASLAYNVDSPNNIYCEWVYHLPTTITKFEVSPNGETLVAFDLDGNLGIWNTATKQSVLFDLANSKNYNGILGFDFLNNGDLITWSKNSVKKIDVYTGKAKWTIDDINCSYSKDSLIGENSEYLYLTGTDSSTIYKINSADGILAETISLPYGTDSDSLSTLQFIRTAKLSPDGKHIAYVCAKSFSESMLAIYDIDSKKSIFGENGEVYISNIDWLDNDNLLTATVLSITETSMSFGSTEFVSTDNTVLQCFSTVDLKEKWHNDFICTDTSYESGFFKFKNNDNVLYYSGNLANLYDSKTGELIQSFNTNDSIINVSDINEDGVPNFILNNGKYAVPLSNKKSIGLYPYFSDNLVDAQINKGFYTMKSGNEIMYYGTHVYDTEWKEIDYNTVLSDDSGHILTDNILGVYEGKDDKLYLIIYDLKNWGNAVEALIDEESSSTIGYSTLYTDNNNIYLCKGSLNGIELITVNIKNGNTTKEIISEQTQSSAPKTDPKNGYLIYLDSPSYDENVITIYDIKSKLSKSYALPDGSDTFSFSQPQYYPESHTILHTDSKYFYIIDTETGNVVTADIPEYWTTTSYYSYNTVNGNYLITDSKNTIMINSSGQIVFTISSSGYTANGISFYDDGNPKTENQILIAYTNRTLYRYSETDGRFLGKSDLRQRGDSNDEGHFEFDNENHLLYFEAGNTLNIIDTEYWIDTTLIDFCYGHHKPTDRFITYTYDIDKSLRIGYFEHYTTEHLIEKGLEFLNGEELTDDQKSKYGISDDD